MFRDPVVIVLTAVAALVRFATLDSQSFWYDEALTFQLVNDSFGGMIEGVFDHEAQPPPYFVLAWLWAHVFGDGEVGLRSLSAVAGTLTVPVAYECGRLVAGRRVAIAAGALTAVSPPLVWYALEARAYALMTLFAALALMFFLRSLEAPVRRNLVGWAITSVLAVATHYFALFLVVPMGAWLLWSAPDRRRVLPYLGGAAAGLLVVAPMLLYQRSHGGVDWIGEIPLWPRVRDVVFFFVAGPTGAGDLTDHRVGVFAVGLLALAVTAGLALALSDAAVRRRVLIVLGLGATVMLAPFVAAAVGSDFILDRNFLAAWVPLTIVVAAGLCAPRLRWAGPAAVAIVCVGFAAIVLGAWPRNDIRQRDDWRAVADAIPSDGTATVVAVSPHWHSNVLAIYERGLHPLGEPEPVSRVVTVELETFVPFGSQVTTIAPPPPFHETRFQRVQNFTVVEYTAPEPVVVDPAALRGQGTNRAEPFLLG